MSGKINKDKRNKDKRAIKQKAELPEELPAVTNLNESMKKPRFSKKHKWILAIVIFVLSFAVVIGAIVAYGYFNKKPNTKDNTQPLTKVQPPEQTTGKILLADRAVSYDAAQTLALIKQTNKAFDTPFSALASTGIRKQLIRYTSSDGSADDVPVYARIYYPQNKTTKQLPILAFAPGTTGMGDDCAASLENPAKRNWANYDSLMAAYASQGYIVVITDYEGMRDSKRIHHYMVGELEGRAVLDSIRAVKNLDTTKNNINSSAIFVGGYSQGGHAAYWANQLAPSYAAEIDLAGAIGYGPVTDVSQTLTDAITGNANINWFGPYVLVSYQDWYKHTYPADKILLPKWNLHLRTDVLTQCVDMVDKFWPNNTGTNKSAQVYTPEFIAAAHSGSLANDKNYQQFATDMFKNITGTVKRNTPILINQGLHDNVILPRQSTAAKTRFCSTGNAVTFKEYDKSPYAVQAYNPTGLVDHYQTMNASYKDSLSWMNNIIAGAASPNSCI